MKDREREIKKEGEREEEEKVEKKEKVKKREDTERLQTPVDLHDQNTPRFLCLKLNSNNSKLKNRGRLLQIQPCLPPLKGNQKQ